VEQEPGSTPVAEESKDEPEPHLSVVGASDDSTPVAQPQLAVVESAPETEDEGVEEEPNLEPEPEATVEPEPDPEPEPEPEQEPKAAAPPRAADVPRFVEYSPTHVRGYLLGAVFVVASVAAVLTSFVAVSESSAAALVIAGGCMVLALVAWWGLLGWRPTVVTIRDGVLHVTRSDTYDLTDPATVVTFTGKPGSPAWAASVRQANGPRTALRSSQVKPRQFERIVRAYRSSAAAESPVEHQADRAKD
jgi:hypothetical protein